MSFPDPDYQPLQTGGFRIHVDEINYGTIPTSCFGGLELGNGFHNFPQHGSWMISLLSSYPETTLFMSFWCSSECYFHLSIKRFSSVFLFISACRTKPLQDALGFWWSFYDSWIWHISSKHLTPLLAFAHFFQYICCFRFYLYLSCHVLSGCILQHSRSRYIPFIWNLSAHLVKPFVPWSSCYLQSLHNQPVLVPFN